MVFAEIGSEYNSHQAPGLLSESLRMGPRWCLLPKRWRRFCNQGWITTYSACKIMSLVTIC